MHMPYGFVSGLTLRVQPKLTHGFFFFWNATDVWFEPVWLKIVNNLDLFGF
jgi:hypothetical protein